MLIAERVRRRRGSLTLTGAGSAGGPSSLLTGLLADWKLNEASGNRIDNSGASRTLAKGGVNDVGQGVGIVTANAAAFASASTEYFLTAAHLAALDGATTLSVAGWVNLIANNVAYTILASGDSGVTDFQRVLQYRGDIDGKFRVNIPTAVTDSATFGLSATASPTVSTWYHVAFVFDGSQVGNAGRLKIYVNGAAEAVGFTGTIPAALDTNTRLLSMGALSDSANPFNGRMNQFDIWKAALTATQIANHYNSGSGVQWPFTGVP